MKLKLKQCYFYLLGLPFRELTLSSKTWLSLKKASPFLKEVRKDQIRYKKTVKMNNLLFAFTSIITIGLLFLGLCFVREEFVQSNLGWLLWTNVPFPTGYDVISVTMSTAATIIGLSFVVIGFLFETVRNKSQQTFEDIFRVTKLYYVFAISITGVLFMVGMNTLKYSVKYYTAGNFALFSSLILFITVIAIAILFAKVLGFLNPEKIAQFSKTNLLNAAKFQYLNERFMRESSVVFEQTLIDNKLIVNETPFWNIESFTTLGLINQPRSVVKDLMLPALIYFSKKIQKRSAQKSPVQFSLLYISQQLPENQAVLHFDENTKIKRWEKKIFSYAFLLGDPMETENDFSKQKAQLLQRLLTSAERGDMELLEQSLDDMDDLYNIYLKGEK